jgi:hypothetical protein|nr:hypothetical protein [uncultured Veillonella sp.]
MKEVNGNPPIESKVCLRGEKKVDPKPEEAFKMPDTIIVLRIPTRETIDVKIMPKEMAPAPAPRKNPIAIITVGKDFTKGSIQSPII